MSAGRGFIALMFLLAAQAGAQAPADSLPDWKRYVWEDLQPILSRAEESALLALPDAQTAAEWQRRFWLARDPTPSTAENERRDEHFKRLETARALYAADSPTRLDQRGLDYVLFGPPDEVAELEEYFDEQGHHPARLTWFWIEPPMRATYADWNLDGAWEQAWDEYPSSRVDVAQRLSQAYLQDGSADDTRVLDELRLKDPAKYQDFLRQLALGEFTNPLELNAQALISELAGPKFRRMEGTYFQNRRERKDIYVHDFGAPPLENVYFAVDCFRGEGGKTRVELSHQIPIRDLTFEWDLKGQVFRARLLRRVIFFNADQNEASSSEDRLPISAESIEDTRSSLLVPGLDVHQLRPGSYRLVLHLEDVASGRLQVFSNPRVEVPAFPPGELSLSDISFASLLERGDKPAIFRKCDWIVYPHPLRAYAADREIRFYFEIYGLGTDSEDLNDYTVTYRIRRQNPPVDTGWLWTREEVIDAELSSTFMDRQGGEMACHALGIAAGDFAEDSYQLEVEVLDRLGGRQARGSGRFSVMPAAALR